MGYIDVSCFSFLGFLLTHLPLVSAPQEDRNKFISAASGFLLINGWGKMRKIVFYFLYEAIIGFVGIQPKN